MDGIRVDRQQILETVSTLPDETLLELAGFLDYLHYKSVQQSGNPNQNSSSFLLAVAGIGKSGQQDIPERDEEILSNEIDPISGWVLKPNSSS